MLCIVPGASRQAEPKQSNLLLSLSRLTVAESDGKGGARREAALFAQLAQALEEGPQPAAGALCLARVRPVPRPCTRLLLRSNSAGQQTHQGEGSARAVTAAGAA